MIGAFAAQASGAPIPPTLDIDFTASSSPENLRRIADALRELGARLRVASIPDGVPFDPAPQLIAQMAMLNLTCRYGDFHLAFHPSGTGGFEDLTERATTVLIGDTEARVAGLADVIRSKRAAAQSLVVDPGRRRASPVPDGHEGVRDGGTGSCSTGAGGLVRRPVVVPTLCPGALVRSRRAVEEALDQAQRYAAGRLPYLTEAGSPDTRRLPKAIQAILSLSGSVSRHPSRDGR